MRMPSYCRQTRRKTRLSAVFLFEYVSGAAVIRHPELFSAVHAAFRPSTHFFWPFTILFDLPRSLFDRSRFYSTYHALYSTVHDFIRPTTLFIRPFTILFDLPRSLFDCSRFYSTYPALYSTVHDFIRPTPLFIRPFTILFDLRIPKHLFCGTLIKFAPFHQLSAKPSSKQAI
ncbi:hypothetical protein SRABI134_04958 [Peribacillus sp. Bi134]|nr:hypothetical protein SRABI134_04958 [Peribacillus sp. Bi134]